LQRILQLVPNNVKGRIKGRLPDSLLFGQLVLRRARSWQKIGLIFVHVPKNGGTSINSSLYGQFMGHFRVQDIERMRPDLLRGLPSLAVTRNPWARAYSAWNFARKGAEMTDGAQIRHAGRYRGSDFVNFERFVLEWLPRQDLDSEDYVFRPQSHFLLSRVDKIGVSHLGQIEDANTYLPFLEETLGSKIEIGHLNRTSDTLRYREVYTPEMRDTLARCYADDLKRFDYDF
jgi:hypothetical protein